MARIERAKRRMGRCRLKAPIGGLSRGLAVILALALVYTVVHVVLLKGLGIVPWVAATAAFVLLIPVHLFADRLGSPFRPRSSPRPTARGYAAVLSLGALLNGGLVWLHNVVLLAGSIESQVLSVPAVLAVDLLLLSWLSSSARPAARREREARWAVGVAVLLAIVGGTVVYFSATSIVLLTNDLIYWDEWRLYDDYLAEKPFLATIFERHERVDHITPIPHVFFMANLFLLDGRGIWLGGCILLANLLLCGVVSSVYIAAARRLGIHDALVALGCIALALTVFWLPAYRSLYWGIGLMYYLAALGAIAASAGLAFGRPGRPVPLGYLAGAVLASASFSAGAAAWFLAPIAAVVKRSSPKAIIGATGLALAGGAITVGHFALGERGLLEFAVPRSVVEVVLLWISFVLLLIGKPIAFSLFGGNLFGGTFTESEGLMVTALVGAVGALAWVFSAAAVVFALGNPRRFPAPRVRAVRREWLFFALLSTFGLGAAGVVAIGRAPAGLNIALEARFTHIGVLFWIGVLGCILLGANAFPVLGARATGWRKWSYLAMASLIAAIVVVGNLRTVDEVLPRLINNLKRRELMLLVDPEGHGARMRLWRPDKTEVVLGVAEEIRQRGKNVFATRWKGAVGETVEDLGYQLTDVRCVGRFSLRRGSGNSVRVTGWASTAGARDVAVRGVLFVRQGRIEGLGLPFFGPAPASRERSEVRRHMRENVERSPSAFSELPGVSGRFEGLVRTGAGESGRRRRPSSSTPFDAVFGILGDERICWVERTDGAAAGGGRDLKRTNRSRETRRAP